MRSVFCQSQTDNDNKITACGQRRQRELTILWSWNVLYDRHAVAVEDVVIAVDRCERGSGSCSAVEEMQNELSLKIHPILQIHDIVNYLTEKKSLSEELQSSIAGYLSEYGAS